MQSKDESLDKKYAKTEQPQNIDLAGMYKRLKEITLLKIPSGNNYNGKKLQ